MRLLRNPILLLVLAVLTGWGVHAGSRPPAPQPADAPPGTFSAGRAGELLDGLYAELGPHVAGSPANAVLRDRIVQVLEASGYRPEVQRRYDCNPMFATCAPVENIIAVLDGSGATAAAILLTSHYDSNWAGPGVADSGAGVAAVLEIARMAAQTGPFRHDLVFLLTDAEEQGLNGAHAFAALHPLFARVRAVINLEARGVAGSSAMFETADGNRGMIRLLAKNLERPVANSLTYEMYRRMPNDTDFSVYRAHPLSGVNFAFTEGVSAYHSAIDDLARLDRASLQHHGQNAWAVLRALDQRTLERLVSPEDAVYLDLFGRSLLHFPESTAAGLALVIGMLVLIAIRRAQARRLLLRQFAWAAVAVLAVLLALPAAGWLLSWPLGRWPDLHGLDHPHPWVGRLVLLLAACWLVYRLAWWLAPRAATGHVMMASWGACALLALGLATTLPAASFVPLLPLVAFLLGLLPDAFRWRREPRVVFASLCGFLAALYVGFYLVRMLETITNFDQAALRMLPLALPAIAALPMLVDGIDRRGTARPFGIAAGVLILAGCLAQWLLPAYTPDRPRDMAVYYRAEAGQPGAHMVLESVFGSIDRDYASAHGFARMEFAGSDAPGAERMAVAAEPLELPALEFVARDVGAGAAGTDSQRWLVDFTVPPELRALAWTLPEGAALQRAVLDGQVVFDAGLPAHRPRDERRLLLHYPPAGARRLELAFTRGAGAAGDLRVGARFDLPPERLEPFRASWPADAQPAFRGPRAMVYYRVPLVADRPENRTGEPLSEERLQGGRR